MSWPEQVVLDACVMANASLCDTLLRLAEPPRLFEPRWSQEIIRETTRTLESKLGWPPSLTSHFEAELGAHFSEAWINGYESLIARMKNDWKDRHVLAAAVHSGAQIVLTFNLRDFKPEHLSAWGVTAIHPQEFLIQFLRENRGLVMEKLEQQAADRGRSLGQLLDILSKTVPEFSKCVRVP